MSLTAKGLLHDMIGAAKDSAADQWPTIKSYAEKEFKAIAESIVMIEKLHVQGEITEKQAKLILRIKRDTARVVLLTIQGLAAITVERAINSALSSVKTAVNKALGFALL